MQNDTIAQMEETMSEQNQAAPPAPVKEDPIRYHMAQKIKEASDKNKEIEQSLQEKNEETKRMMQRIKELEESVKMYHNKDQERLRMKFDTKIRPVSSQMGEFCPDEETKSYVQQYEKYLGDKINHGNYETDAIKNLEKEVAFVETVASAFQIKSSAYEAQLKKEQEALQKLKERDEQIKTMQTDIEKSTKEHQETLKKLQNELEETKKELEKASLSIKNTEAHLENTESDQQQDQQQPMEEMDDLERETPRQQQQQQVQQMQTGGFYQQQPQHGFGGNYIETVAGANGVGTAEDMYNLYDPNGWRSINTNVTRDMYSEQVYNMARNYRPPQQ